MTPSRFRPNNRTFEGKGAAEAVFDANLARLASVKGRYDPDNIFRRNTNLSPRKR